MMCVRGGTVDHVFWHCPRCVQQRPGNSRCGEGAGGSLKACQRLPGAPALLSDLAAWRRDCTESVWTPPPWNSDELYVDGSGRQPKKPHARVIGWAVCGKVRCVWHEASGRLEPGSTVIAGKATAAAHAVELLNPHGLVVADCQAVKRMRDRIRTEPGSVSALAGRLPRWVLLAEPLRRHATEATSRRRGPWRPVMPRQGTKAMPGPTRPRRLPLEHIMSRCRC